MNGTGEKRALSERQARKCEEAQHPVCRCRCGGRLHGAKRYGASSAPSLDWYTDLPSDDPHYVESAAVKEERKRLREEAKRQEREEQQRRYWEARAKMEASRHGTRSDW